MDKNICFYMRDRDTFVEVYETSQRDYLYKIFEDFLPSKNGVVIPCSADMFDKVFIQGRQMRNAINTLKEELFHKEEIINRMVEGFAVSDSAEDFAYNERFNKVIDDTMRQVEDYEGEISDITDAMYFVDTLLKMQIFHRFAKNLEANPFIYVGVNCGTVTVNDVVGK